MNPNKENAGRSVFATMKTRIWLEILMGSLAFILFVALAGMSRTSVIAVAVLLGTITFITIVRQAARSRVV